MTLRTFAGVLARRPPRQILARVTPTIGRTHDQQTFRAARWATAVAGTRAPLYYQGPEVPTSVISTGHVGTYRDGLGSDGEFFGVDPTPHDVDIADGRGMNFTLDANGFSFVDHRWNHIDYYDNDSVLDTYYPECEALVCAQTGAKFAVAFDHNIRAKSRKSTGETLSGGNAVQEPLITYGIHNDYTATSAPSRIKQLSEVPKHNDTLRSRLGDRPAVDPQQVDRLLRGRWLFVNVWRNIASTPVQRFPLALCDAATTSVSDLVVFEIRYADRVGENYFTRWSSEHSWYYFPEATKDEAVLLKCWDSRGRDFVHMMPGQDQDSLAATNLAPATFSLHTGFVDPATTTTAPDRESIEIRLVAFFDDA